MAFYVPRLEYVRDADGRVVQTEPMWMSHLQPKVAVFRLVWEDSQGSWTPNEIEDVRFPIGEGDLRHLELIRGYILGNFDNRGLMRSWETGRSDQILAGFVLAPLRTYFSLLQDYVPLVDPYRKHWRTLAYIRLRHSQGFAPHGDRLSYPVNDDEKAQLFRDHPELEEARNAVIERRLAGRRRSIIDKLRKFARDEDELNCALLEPNRDKRRELQLNILQREHAEA